ncbi:uncharacterized protein HaLaN_26662, partial [Haematococcus lacustris]
VGGREVSDAKGWEILDLASAMCSAPLTSQLQMAATVMRGQDAMLSSWQFPYWDVDFGQGGPLRFQGLLYPNPPWSAAVMQAHPSDTGLYLFLVTPTAAIAALKNSRVLAQLAPAAKWA